MGDALGYGSSFDSRIVRGFVALIMIIGATIAIAFGSLPIELMIFAQSITIFIVPFIGVSLFLIANDEKIMGNLKNKGAAQISGILGLVVLAALAVKNIQSLFF
jgi:Mn2+/Fe2+ NRAMP family transporter